MLMVDDIATPNQFSLTEMLEASSIDLSSITIFFAAQLELQCGAEWDDNQKMGIAEHGWGRWRRVTAEMQMRPSQPPNSAESSVFFCCLRI